MEAEALKSSSEPLATEIAEPEAAASVESEEFVGASSATAGELSPPIPPPEPLPQATAALRPGDSVASLLREYVEGTATLLANGQRSSVLCTLCESRAAMAHYLPVSCDCVCHRAREFLGENRG